MVVLCLEGKKNQLVEFDNAFVRKNLNSKNFLVPKSNYASKEINLLKLFGAISF